MPVRIELPARALAALPVARPTDETWTQVEQWGQSAARAGQHFGITDLMIAALTRELGALVWSLDGDFQRMADLGFVQHY